MQSMDGDEEVKDSAVEKVNEDSDDSDDGSLPQLSAHALSALQDFYAEQAALEQQLVTGERGFAAKPVAENWVKSTSSGPVACTLIHMHTPVLCV